VRLLGVRVAGLGSTQARAQTRAEGSGESPGGAAQAGDGADTSDQLALPV